MLVINAEDIKSCISVKDVLTAVEQAFIIQENGNFTMPDRMHIEVDGNVLL